MENLTWGVGNPNLSGSEKSAPGCLDYIGDLLSYMGDYNKSKAGISFGKGPNSHSANGQPLNFWRDYIFNRAKIKFKLFVSRSEMAE